MLSSLLLKYFKGLSKRDRRELSKFVRSPFHNQRQEVIRLFDYLNGHFDTPSVKALAKEPTQNKHHSFKKEIVFTAIYPDKQDFNDALMRATMSQLTEAIKAFFVHNDLKDNEKYVSERAYILRQSLILRGYKEEYEQHLEQNYINSSNGELHASFNHYVILNEKMYWQAKYNRSKSLYLTELSETLDTAYVVELLRIACRMKSHKAITIVDYKLEMLETVLERIEAGWLKEHLYVQVFYNAYWTMEYKEENYLQLDKILKDSFHPFEVSDLSFLYEVALNYNIHLSNYKDAEATVAIWWYLKTGYERKILMQDNVINPHNVIATISMGLSRYVNDVEWVDNFMNEYKKHLPPMNREDYVLLIDGIYYFYKKNYEKSMLALKKISFEDEYHQFKSRRMLAVMYFELGEFVALTSHLDSFKVYLYRLKTVAYQKEAHLQFIRFVEKLMKINLDSEKERHSLWTQIEQVECIAMLVWFKEILLKN